MALARPAVALTAVLLASGCVDHGANSAKFCRRNAELLAPDRDGDTYTKDQAVYYSDQVEKSMRYAEDGSRTVRRKARQLADAYDDLRGIAGDEDVPADEVESTYEKLVERRAAMRDVCRDVLDT